MSRDGSPETSVLLWKAIAEMAGTDWLVFDQERSVVLASPAAKSRFGFPDDELIGRSLATLISGPQSNQEAQLCTVGKEQDMQGCRKDGSEFPVRWTTREIDVPGQRLYVGLIREMACQDERQARLEAIMNHAVDAIITIDERGLIDSVNPATQKLFGYREEELLGRNVKILMPEPYQSEHDGYLANFRETGVRKIIGIGREVTGRRQDGSEFPMHLAVSEIRLGDRRLFTGMVRDITDLKKVEQQLADVNEQLEHRVQLRTKQLREAQAELVRNEKFSTLGKVSGGIAHEIRNPLNAVKTSAYYLLNAKQPSPKKVEEHLQRIDRQVMLIDNVVTALSDVAKLPDAQLGTLDLASFVHSTVRSITLPQNIEIEMDIPDRNFRVLADESQLTIALLNLLRNARDAMTGGGKMTLQCRQLGDQVELSVMDTGSGIAASDLGKVMEPLFTTKARGMGLGLSITRAIVEKNQGSLHVESELDQGSRFSIRLQTAPTTA